MQIALYQIDAFSDTVFSGNPAAVCPLDTWLPDDRMQVIAAENNLSETAFFVKEGDGFGLRWFTPICEVDLCGHATLATAYLLFTRLEPRRTSVVFHTRSGPLTVTREKRLVVMDFPAKPPRVADAEPGLIGAVGGEPAAVLAADDYLLVFDNEETIRGLRPRMDGLLNIGRRGVIVTAPGNDCDFVSRFFAPSHGIPEDPVTGSAHCSLTPYWSKRLGRADLHARQVSSRGGVLVCRDRGDRVHIAGHAALYLEGTIAI